ncbi:MAG TPA: DUF4267 domain-containing protein [Devosia sp.]|jgi:hypothetical protein|uniref:DUF4267 domain-containing protein n=1 Tax=Devosia sp. TaxID=1871048 RepID=UPI002F92AD13
MTMMLACAFALLGLLFVLAPEPASALFGIPSASPDAYVRALGIRDLALSTFIIAIAPVSIQALRRLLAASALIPAGDIFLVSVLGSPSSAWPLILHAASAAVLVSLAAAAPKGTPQS